MSIGLELILPYVAPLEPYILDDEASEIMINPGGAVFIERYGLITAVPVAIEERLLYAAVRNIARLLGDDISPERPLLDARMPDGSRVAAAMPPASIGGTLMNIRKFRSKVFTIDELVERRMLSPADAAWLIWAIEQRKSIVISGGTGTGKSTLLNALAAHLPPEDRLAVIEETTELRIEARNMFRLEARRAQPDIEAVTVRDLVRQCLRHRPDRIIVGEVRGGEAFDLLQAMNTGHTGTLTTIHANEARLAIPRLRTCIAMSGVDLPASVIARNIADATDVVVHITRRDGVRAVQEMVRVRRYDLAADRYEV